MASVNRYLGVEAGPGDTLHLAYLLDFAELPAAAELAQADRDRDGAITPAERDAYLDALLPPLLARWSVEVDGTPVTPRVMTRALEAPPGEGNLNTLRVLAEVTAEIPAGAARDGTVVVRVHDPAYAERGGWREIRADDSAQGSLVASSVVDAARDGGAPGAQRMMRVDEATFTFRLRGHETAAAPPLRAPPSSSRGWRVAGLALLALLALAGAALAKRGGRWFAALDPRTRVLLTVATAASVALVPTGRAPALAGHALVIAALLAGARPRPRWALPRLVAAAAWGALPALARALAGQGHGPSDHATLGARVALALTATLPLAATTPVTTLAAALAGLRLPAAFVEVTAATARGLVLLRAESERLSHARQLRAPDARLGARVGLYGTLASTLIDRGLRRAERSHLAMTLRGFDGASHGAHSPLATDDARALILLAMALVGMHLLP
jgi:energy-coupling factor transporter transmembrane protein EcfT